MLLLLGAGCWGWGLNGCGILRLGMVGLWWCWVGGLGGGCVWVVGEKLGHEFGIHCCYLDGAVIGDWLVVRLVGG